MDPKTDPPSPTAPDASDEKQQHTTRDEVYIDPKEEKALLRKLDRWIVPPVMLLYLFSFLDRVSPSILRGNSTRAPSTQKITQNSKEHDTLLNQSPSRSTSATPASTAWKKT